MKQRQQQAAEEVGRVHEDFEGLRYDPAAAAAAVGGGDLNASSTPGLQQGLGSQGGGAMGFGSSSSSGVLSQGPRAAAGNRRQRLVWTPDLHVRFLVAVNQLGISAAAPKSILAIMQAEGLTRENVASHLQKYR